MTVSLFRENLRSQPEATQAIAEGNVASVVAAEVVGLQAMGYDVQLVNTVDVYAPTPERQTLIDARVAELEVAVDGAEQFRRPEGLSKWTPLTKRAIALKTLYEPNAVTVGEGIDPAIYDRPLFGGASAKQVLQAFYGSDKAQIWIDKYENFIPAVIDDGNSTELGSRDFFMGVKDAEAVRTRATAAMEMVTEHITNSPLLAERNDLVSASLACGAAGPVYQMVNELEAQGHNFEKVILVDQDPMALATAVSVAERDNLDQKISVNLQDLLRTDITEYIAPHSVDVVDLLGLFEYFPQDVATELLKRVKDVVRPGGMIVFGNMLNERPQQHFFSKVVKWPRLQQRKIQDVLDIAQSAGYSAGDMSVRVPSEGVYAVYGIRVPELIDVSDTEVSNGSVLSAIGHQAVLERY